MWILLSTVAAMLSAIYYLLAQNLKIKANVFVMYSGLSVAIFLTPIIILKPVVFPLSFYLISIVQGVASAYVDYFAFSANKKYGSETVASIIPFSVIITFVLWCFIDNQTVQNYLENPFKSLLIIFSLIGILFSLRQYHKIKFTKEAFYTLLPVLFVISFIVIMNKITMNNYSNDNLIMCACWRDWILALVKSVIHLVIAKFCFSYEKMVFPKDIIKSLVFVIAIAYMLLKSLALYYSQNPTYVTILCYTSLFWVMFFESNFKIFKFSCNSKQVDKKWKIVFLLFVILFLVVV